MGEQGRECKSGSRGGKTWPAPLTQPISDPDFDPWNPTNNACGLITCQKNLSHNLMGQIRVNLHNLFDACGNSVISILVATFLPIGISSNQSIEPYCSLSVHLLLFHITATSIISYPSILPKSNPCWWQIPLFCKRYHTKMVKISPSLFCHYGVLIFSP